MRIALVLLFASAVVVVVSATEPQKHYNKLELIGVENMVDMRGDAHKSLSVSVTPALLNASNEWVTVSWEGVLQPTDQDFIAAYTSPLDLHNTEPTKYKMCNTSDTHMSTGAGSLQFKMINMRHTIVFVFVTGGLSHPIAIAESNELNFENPNEPMQGHIALGATTAEMRVMWTTRDVGTPLLRWGVEEGKFDSEIAADTTTYKREEMCGAPANHTGWMDPGALHSAVITNIKPDTRYYYQYGSVEGGFANGTFMSAPPTGPLSAFNFVAFGDMGQAETDDSFEQAFQIAALNTTRLMARDVTEEDVRLLVHIGDISYARGHASQWDVFFDEVGRTVSKNIPYMTVPGNHERDWPNSGSAFGPLLKDSGGECGVAYEKRMQMPTQGVDEPWYSFDFGSVHFLLISTEHPFGEGTKQNDFVKEDLAKVDRKVTPWVIFGGHRPMYIDSNWSNRSLAGDLDVASDLRDAFESTIVKYGVDLAFWGHHHSYQRTCAVHERICRGKHMDGSFRAPIHMVIGMAGFASSTGIKEHKPWIYEKVDVENHGYARGRVNGTHLTMEFVGDVDGSVLDTITLYKPLK